MEKGVPSHPPRGRMREGDPSAGEGDEFPIPNTQYSILM